MWALDHIVEVNKLVDLVRVSSRDLGSYSPKKTPRPRRELLEDVSAIVGLSAADHL